MASMLLNSQFVFNQCNAGSFDPQIADQIFGFSAGILQTKGGGQWWEFMHGKTAPDFEAAMNHLVETGKSKAAPWLREITG